MIYAEFEDMGAATDHRADHGGWIFLADNGRVFWFRLEFTASAVMKHPALIGMSGRLA